MQTLFLITLLSTACFYLGSRALITRWLWSRYPPDLARFADCSACTGFWYGSLSSLIFGGVLDRVFVRDIAAGPFATVVLEAILVGLVMMVLTPIGAAIMTYSLEVVGSVVETDSKENEDGR